MLLDYTLYHLGVEILGNTEFQQSIHQFVLAFFILQYILAVPILHHNG